MTGVRSSGDVGHTARCQPVFPQRSRHTSENAAHAFGQMPGSLLGQFSLSRALFPSEGVKTREGCVGGGGECCTGLCVFVLTSSGTHSIFLDVPAGCLVPCESCPDSGSLEAKCLNPLV